MPDREYWDIPGADLGVIDPDIDAIIDLEEERQARKLIMIPSESMAPLAVRQALGSVFNNVYAEGYPPLRMTRDDEELLLDYPHQLAYYRRYADRRFYKGVDYVHFVETLAQRRAALIFANERVSDKNVYVNVQPLSGAAANLAVYDTICQSGDTVMGMDLFQGGHLTHGSELNFSGKRYRVASYGEQGQRASSTTTKSAIWLGDTGQDDHRRLHPTPGRLTEPVRGDRARGRRCPGRYQSPCGMAVAGAPQPRHADVSPSQPTKRCAAAAVIMTTDEDLGKRIIGGVPGRTRWPAYAKVRDGAALRCGTDAFKRMMYRIKERSRAGEGLGRTEIGLRWHGHASVLTSTASRADGRCCAANPVRILTWPGSWLEQSQAIPSPL
jgi:glycine hydroxymethyltransferase